MVIPRFFYQALKGDPVTIYGTGAQTRDFTYIDEVVEATVKVAQKCQGCEIINVAKGDDISVLAIAKKIVEITDSKSEILFLESEAPFPCPPHCGRGASRQAL